MLKYLQSGVWRLFFLSLILQQQAISQGVRFFAATDADKVQINSTFTLEYTLENAEAQSFTLPDISPFRVVAGPATSTSLSIINGARSSRMTYQYSILATKTGKFTIPSAKIKSGNRILESNAITIEVLKQADNRPGITSDEDELSFVRMEISADRLVRGQQAVLDYVLYTRQNVESFNILSEPSFDGFFASPPGDFRAQAKRHSLNGKEYVSQILRRMILFPQKTGKYIFEPVVCELAIPVEGSRGSFFFSRDIKRINVTTNSVSIEVVDLPGDAPSTFSGAVGDYTMRAVINKNTVNTDDAIVIRMEVDGNGDAKIIKAPELEHIPHATYYEPNLTRDEQYSKNGLAYNVKEFEYIIIPERDTLLSIVPAFSYYDPQQKKYITIEAGPFEVKVVRSDNTKTNVDAQGTVNGTISGLYPVRGLQEVHTPLFGSLIHIIMLAILVISGIIIYLVYKRRLADASTDPAEKRRQLAGKLAVQKLDTALKLRKEQNTRGFFEEISQAVNGYIRDKYQLKNSAMNKSEMISLLDSKLGNKSLLEDYKSIYAKCEMALYAGASISMEDVYEQSLKLIQDLETNSFQAG